MNVALIKKYVARKAVKGIKDPVLREEMLKMTRGGDPSHVMDLHPGLMSPELRCDIEKVIIKRYDLKPHPRLFSSPNIGQWIADITGVFTTDDVIAYFSQKTGVRASQLGKTKIGSQVVTRPYLISLVEKLEDVTGRTLTLPENDTPLAYLGEDITFDEIAKFFSTSSETISYLRRRYCRSVKRENLPDSLDKFRKQALCVYRLTAEVGEDVSDEMLLKMPVRRLYPKQKGFTENDWDLPIFWAEDELRIQLPSFSKNITEDTVVGELINMMVSTKEREMLRQHVR